MNDATGTRRVAAERLAAALRRPDWHRYAACHGQLQVMFPAQRGKPLSGPATERARAVCRSCEVVDDCLAWAVAARPSDGVWAGMTPSEIRRYALAIQSAAS